MRKRKEECQTSVWSCDTSMITWHLKHITLSLLYHWSMMDIITYSIMVMPVIGLCMNNQSHLKRPINQVMQRPLYLSLWAEIFTRSQCKYNKQGCCHLLYSNISLSSIITLWLLTQVLVHIVVYIIPVNEIWPVDWLCSLLACHCYPTPIMIVDNTYCDTIWFLDSGKKLSSYTFDGSCTHHTPIFFLST